MKHKFADIDLFAIVFRIGISIKLYLKLYLF